jgi:hypothetical protein
MKKNQFLKIESPFDASVFISKTSGSKRGLSILLCQRRGCSLRGGGKAIKRKIKGVPTYILILKYTYRIVKYLALLELF